MKKGKKVNLGGDTTGGADSSGEQLKSFVYKRFMMGRMPTVRSFNSEQKSFNANDGSSSNYDDDDSSSDDDDSSDDEDDEDEERMKKDLSYNIVYTVGPGSALPWDFWGAKLNWFTTVEEASFCTHVSTLDLNKFINNSFII